MNHKRISQQGSTLIITLIAIVALSGASAALLAISTYRNREAVQAFDYTKAFYITQAGVNASIAEISADYDYDGDGKGIVSGSFDSGDYSVNAVDEGEDVWTITSTGTNKDLTRGIQVVVRRSVETPFDKGAFGGAGLNMTGQGFVDSYDTDDGTYASQAVNINPVTGLPYANSNGNVGTNNDLAATGQVNIYGSATPGPGGTVTTGPQTVITGSQAPAEEEVELNGFPYEPPIESAGPLVLAGSNIVTLGAGTYRYDYLMLSAKSKLVLGQNSGDVLFVYIDGVISITGQSELTVTDGAKVTLLHGGLDLGKNLINADISLVPDINFAGQGIVNTSQIPASLIIISSGDGIINLAGQSDMHGVIYAPSGTINFSGQADVFGSLTGNTINISGQGDLHYDEALSRLNIGQHFPYRVRSWREFKP